MTLSVVLADANILYSRTLRDYFLYASDAGAIALHGSQDGCTGDDGQGSDVGPEPQGEEVAHLAMAVLGWDVADGVLLDDCWSDMVILQRV